MTPQLLQEEGYTDPSGGSQSWHQKPTRAVYFCLFALLAISMLIRFFCLNADPDWRLDWNPGLLTDEAFYMHNARNAVLFGSARMDEFNNMTLSPLVHVFDLIMFKTFGVGYVQGRLVSAIIGLASLALMFRIGFLLAKYIWKLDKHALLIGLASAACLGIDHLFSLYNRLALLETPVAFCCLLSIWSLLEGKTQTTRSKRFCYLIFSGLSSALAVAIKTNAAIFPVAILLGFVCYRCSNWKAENAAEQQNMNKAFLLFSGSLVAGLALWIVIWVAPNAEEWIRMNSFYLRDQGRARTIAEFGSALFNATLGWKYGLFHFLSVHSPIIWLGMLILVASVALSRKLRTSLTATEWIFLLWACLGFLQMMTIRVAPDRYIIAFYPAMIIACFILAVRWHVASDWLMRKSWQNYTAATLISGLAFYFFVMTILPKAPWRGLNFPAVKPQELVILLPLSLAIGLFIVWLVNKTKFLRRKSATIGYAVLGFFLGLQGYWLASYFGNLSYDMRDFNRFVSRTVPSNAVLAGVAFETPIRYFFVFDGLCNWRRPIEDYGATHVMVHGAWDTPQKEWFYYRDINRLSKQRSGANLEESIVADGLHVGPYRFTLYRITEWIRM